MDASALDEVDLALREAADALRAVRLPDVPGYRWVTVLDVNDGAMRVDAAFALRTQ